MNVEKGGTGRRDKERGEQRFWRVTQDDSGQGKATNWTNSLENIRKNRFGKEGRKKGRGGACRAFLSRKKLHFRPVPRTPRKKQKGVAREDIFSHEGRII